MFFFCFAHVNQELYRVIVIEAKNSFWAVGGRTVTTAISKTYYFCTLPHSWVKFGTGEAWFDELPLHPGAHHFKKNRHIAHIILGISLEGGEGYMGGEWTKSIISFDAWWWVNCYTVQLIQKYFCFPTNRSVSCDSFVNLHVLQQVGLLPERLGAGVALEGLLSCVGSQVDLDVGLVEEAPIADVAPVDGLLLAGAVCCHHRRHLGFTRTVLVFGSATRSSTTARSATAASAAAHRIVEIAQVLLLVVVAAATLDSRRPTCRSRIAARMTAARVVASAEMR